MKNPLCCVFDKNNHNILWLRKPKISPTRGRKLTASASAKDSFPTSSLIGSFYSYEFLSFLRSLQ